MKGIAKRLIELLPGESAMAVLGALRRMRYPRLRREKQVEQIVLRKLGSPNRVLGGPFKGMRYISAGYYGSGLPKILGVYELELAGAIDRICQSRPDVIVDIGAAEGYFAAGMAVRIPHSRIVGFEMYKPARALLKRQAQANEAGDRLEIQGFCDPQSLRASLAPAQRPAVICDCEGGEDLLMDPGAVPKLKSSIMLIEIHEQSVPGVSGRIANRFSDTHALEVIQGQPRRREDLPVKIELSDEEFSVATYERSVSGLWYFFLPREGFAA